MAFLDLNTDIKPWLGIDVLNTTHDSVLNVINAAMEQAIKNYTEQEFALSVVVGEVLDANQSDQLIPRNYPIVSVQNIYFFTSPDGSNGSLIDPSDYQVLPNAIVFQGKNTPFGRSRIAIDYTWGYDGLPDDVKLCMLQSVEAEFRRKGNKTLGIGGRSKKDESETYRGGSIGEWDEVTGLPKVLVYKLTPYRQYEFPNSPMATRNI
jgi:hypothetical protein